MGNNTWTKALNTTSNDTANNKSSSFKRRPPNWASRSPWHTVDVSGERGCRDAARYERGTLFGARIIGLDGRLFETFRREIPRSLRPGRRSIATSETHGSDLALLTPRGEAMPPAPGLPRSPEDLGTISFTEFSKNRSVGGYGLFPPLTRCPAKAGAPMVPDARCAV